MKKLNSKYLDRIKKDKIKYEKALLNKVFKYQETPLDQQTKRHILGSDSPTKHRTIYLRGWSVDLPY